MNKSKIILNWSDYLIRWLYSHPFGEQASKQPHSRQIFKRKVYGCCFKKGVCLYLYGSLLVEQFNPFFPLLLLSLFREICWLSMEATHKRTYLEHEHQVKISNKIAVCLEKTGLVSRITELAWPIHSNRGFLGPPLPSWMKLSWKEKRAWCSSKCFFFFSAILRKGRSCS